MMNTAAEMSALRRYLTQFLLNVNLDANETLVSTLITLVDHFQQHPEEYQELINDNQRN